MSCASRNCGQLFQSATGFLTQAPTLLSTDVEFDREELVYVEKRGESFIFSRNTESDSESDSDGEESSSEDEIAVNPRVLADTGSFLVRECHDLHPRAV